MQGTHLHLEVELGRVLLQQAGKARLGKCWAGNSNKKKCFKRNYLKIISKKESY
jgi:hypothetical protein